MTYTLRSLYLELPIPIPKFRCHILPIAFINYDWQNSTGVVSTYSCTDGGASILNECLMHSVIYFPVT